jgi:hypothetical protein
MSLAEEQVNERADKRRCPDDDEPEYGTCRRMFIFKEHYGLNNVTNDGYEDEYQEKQRIGYTASISRHGCSPHKQAPVSSGHISCRDRRCVLTLSTRVYGRKGFGVATWFTTFSCGIVSIAL